MSKPTDQSKGGLHSLVEGLLERGEASVVEESNATIFRIRPTKIGQDGGKSATIEEINKSIVNGLLMNEERLKRIYRKRSDLPRPDLPPSAEANLRTKRVNTRLSPEALSEFQECAKHFSSQREALEAAIQLLSARLGRAPAPELPEIHRR